MDTGRKLNHEVILNTHKKIRRSRGRLRNALCAFNFRLVSKGQSVPENKKKKNHMFDSFLSRNLNDIVGRI